MTVTPKTNEKIAAKNLIRMLRKTKSKAFTKAEGNTLHSQNEENAADTPQTEDKTRWRFTAHWKDRVTRRTQNKENAANAPQTEDKIPWRFTAHWKDRLVRRTEELKKCLKEELFSDGFDTKGPAPNEDDEEVETKDKKPLFDIKGRPNETSQVVTLVPVVERSSLVGSPLPSEKKRALGNKSYARKSQWDEFFKPTMFAGEVPQRLSKSEHKSTQTSFIMLNTAGGDKKDPLKSQSKTKSATPQKRPVRDRSRSTSKISTKRPVISPTSASESAQSNAEEESANSNADEESAKSSAMEESENSNAEEESAKSSASDSKSRVSSNEKSQSKTRSTTPQKRPVRGRSKSTSKVSAKKPVKKSAASVSTLKRRSRGRTQRGKSRQARRSTSQKRRSQSTSSRTSTPGGKSRQARRSKSQKRRSQSTSSRASTPRVKSRQARRGTSQKRRSQSTSSRASTPRGKSRQARRGASQKRRSQSTSPKGVKSESTKANAAQRKLISRIRTPKAFTQKKDRRSAGSKSLARKAHRGRGGVKRKSSRVTDDSRSESNMSEASSATLRRQEKGNRSHTKTKVVEGGILKKKSASSRKDSDSSAFGKPKSTVKSVKNKPPSKASSASAISRSESATSKITVSRRTKSLSEKLRAGTPSGEKKQSGNKSHSSKTNGHHEDKIRSEVGTDKGKEVTEASAESTVQRSGSNKETNKDLVDSGITIKKLLSKQLDTVENESKLQEPKADSRSSIKRASSNRNAPVDVAEEGEKQTTMSKSELRKIDVVRSDDKQRPKVASRSSLQRSDSKRNAPDDAAKGSEKSGRSHTTLSKSGSRRSQNDVAKSDSKLEPKMASRSSLKRLVSERETSAEVSKGDDKQDSRRTSRPSLEKPGSKQDTHVDVKTDHNKKVTSRSSLERSSSKLDARVEVKNGDDNQEGSKSTLQKSWSKQRRNRSGTRRPHMNRSRRRGQSSSRPQSGASGTSGFDGDSMSETSKSCGPVMECTYCYQPMVEPKLLPCSHSFCLKCLKEIMGAYLTAV